MKFAMSSLLFTVLLGISSVGLAKTPSSFRIVSYGPALTEILFAMDLGDHIVGTSQFSNHPPEALKIPLVGSYLRPNMEKTIALKPTHVLLMQEGDASILEQLKKTKIPFFVFKSNSLSDYKETLQKLGEVFNKTDRAQELLLEFENQKPKARTSKTLAIQFDESPIIMAGHNTFISEALQLCGLKNVFTFSGYKPISQEQFLQARPDYLLQAFPISKNPKLQKDNPFLKNLKILKGDPDKLSRMGPRLMLAIQEICNQVVE